MEVFGVFEGGGAKGLAHVGALRAAEQRGFRFRAVAGTSIGAMIAALVAAGFKSEDLFRVTEAGELGLLSANLELKFMDGTEYSRVLRLRKHLETLLRQPEPGFRTYIWEHVVSRLWLSWGVAVVAANVSALPLVMHRKVLGDLWWEAGAVGTERLRAWIDETIRVKLGLPAGVPVRFQDLPIDLRVVATDLTRNDMQVFGRDTTPDIPVADAVTASMAYPLFFKPVQLEGSVYVDGGLASNGPAWVLDDLRDMADVRIPTFAFRLLDPLPSALPKRSRRRWLGGTLRKLLESAPKASTRRPKLGPLARRFVTSSLNSRSFLETRRIDEFHLIELSAQLNTLDFDVVNANKAETVEHGARGVSEYLSRKIGPRDPVLMEKALRAFAGLVKEHTHDDGVVRAYVLQPTSEIVGRVVYAAMLEGEADDTLSMRLDTRSQALSLTLREPVLMRTRSLPTEDLRRIATKYIHAARPGDVTHVLSVPIFPLHSAWSENKPESRPAPLAALCFDFRRQGGEHLLLDPGMEDMVSAIAQALGDFWTRMPLSEIECLPEQAGAPSQDWVQLGDPAGFYVSGRKVRACPEPAIAEQISRTVARIGGDAGLFPITLLADGPLLDEASL
ncbi:patatin-like phospholipase family protein [Mesorhizobium sp. M0179]|uniref:patatin-like phospholipase family protein n=1 Tax=Mesorhizobium sp. M0179 TaxID=2956905 RepID=UPI00333BC172